MFFEKLKPHPTRDGVDGFFAECNFFKFALVENNSVICLRKKLIESAEIVDFLAVASFGGSNFYRKNVIVLGGDYQIYFVLVIVAPKIELIFVRIVDEVAQSVGDDDIFQNKTGISQTPQIKKIKIFFGKINQAVIEEISLGTFDGLLGLRDIGIE